MHEAWEISELVTIIGSLSACFLFLYSEMKAMKTEIKQELTELKKEAKQDMKDMQKEIVGLTEKIAVLNGMLGYLREVADKKKES